MISSKAGKRAALSISNVADGASTRFRRVKASMSNILIVNHLRGRSDLVPGSRKRIRRTAVALGLGGVSVVASAAMVHLHRVHMAAVAPKPAAIQPVAIAATPVVAPAKHKTFNPLRGIASWYGAVWHGHTTASGEIFDETKMTAAHNTLPLGTTVRVTNLNSKKSVVVRINDRGDLSPGRIIDLTSGAAERLGMLRAGLAPVKVEVIQPAPGQPVAD